LKEFSDMIAIASDHGGFRLKGAIMEHLKEKNIEYKDMGTYSNESCDYPDFAEKLARSVLSGESELGILVCGTGIGMSIAANKINGIRCALCSDCFSAEMAREHNDANILALGERVLGESLAKKIVDTFLGSHFEGGKHARRVAKIMQLQDK
jgi:ribose 5-phosphate isomerase B